MIFNILSGNSSIRDKFIEILAFLAAAVIAIMTHEIAHGYIALKNGDPTAKFLGRLKFNPRVHFDFLGVLMFLIVGIGWAKPVPINPNNFKNTKKGIVAVSLAGVCANFILAFVAFWLLIFELKFINFTDSSSVLLEGIGYLFFRFFLYSVFINVSLIAFNLLPISPLDGFRLVAAFAPNSKFTYFMSRYGSFILLGIIIIGSIIPAADILGMYISWVQSLVYKLIALVLG